MKRSMHVVLIRSWFTKLRKESINIIFDKWGSINYVTIYGHILNLS
jgi:hypothetical protein